MKYILILLLLLSSCDYDEYFYDTDILPLTTKSLLVKKPINAVQSTLLDDGYTIFVKGSKSETGIKRIKDLGYFKYELTGLGEATKVKILYGKDADNMQYLKYTNDSTVAIYNELIMLFESGDLYYEK